MTIINFCLFIVTNPFVGPYFCIFYNKMLWILAVVTVSCKNSDEILLCTSNHDVSTS